MKLMKLHCLLPLASLAAVLVLPIGLLIGPVALFATAIIVLVLSIAIADYAPRRPLRAAALVPLEKSEPRALAA
jgi:hypothetical protein